MFDSLKRRFAKWLTRSISLSDPFWSDVYLNLQTTAGVPVSEEKSLQLSAVWAAVNLFSSTMGQLPIEVKSYDDETDTFLTTDDHPLSRLFRFRPNPEQSIFSFCEWLQSSALLYGGGFAEIERTLGGVPVNLWPLNSRQTKRVRIDGNVVIQTVVDGKEYFIPYENVLYIPGPLGRSIISVARESIALGLATEKYGAKFFGSGGVPQMIFEHPMEIGPDAVDRIRRQYEERHGGLDRAHRVMILEEGMKATPISIPPEDAQFLTTRQFQVVEIARWFNVPPHFLADLGRSNYASTEQLSQEFITFSLGAWISRWENELQIKLAGDPEKTGLIMKINTNVLLRGDRFTRYKAHQLSLTSGWATVNEVRTEEGKPRIEGGDDLLRPLNMDPMNNLSTDPNEEP